MHRTARKLVYNIEKTKIIPEADDYVCPECEGGGWVFSSYQAAGAPNMQECQECFNYHELPCP